jgi:hypothetical protein
VSAEAALAICKAEWADARLRFSGALDPSTQNLIRATDEFLASDHALDAFKGGWTMEQLFGMGRREYATQCGLICLAARGTIEIVRFDEGRVWIRVANVPEDDDHPISYRPQDFVVSNSQPWWQDQVPLAN